MTISIILQVVWGNGVMEDLMPFNFVSGFIQYFAFIFYLLVFSLSQGGLVTNS